MRRLLFAPILGSLLAGAWAAGAFAQNPLAEKLSRAPIGTPILVTPGQEFYAQVDADPVPAYRLARTFKSSMPGAMGLPFGFAIDTDVLILVFKSASGWDYFVPPDHKFRAFHALLGSVIRGRDMVGLRVGPAGQMEWFVDNSVYARAPTLWTRPIRPADPAINRIDVGVITRGSMDRLVYLGLSGPRHAKIRLEKTAGRQVQRTEFTFPLNKDGKGLGAVNGAEFTIEVTPTQALITVVRAMTSALGDVYPSPPKPILKPVPPI